MVPRILHPRRHRRYPAPARHSPAPLRETHRRHGRLHQRGNPSNSVRLLSGLERRGPSTAAELGAMIDIDRSVISRHASILEQAGPLARSPDERDRRWTALSLTEKSQKAVATMRERLSSIIDDFLDEMARRPRVNLCDDADGIRHDKTLHQVTTATQHSPRRPPTQGRGQVRPKSPHKSASTKPPAFTRTHQGKHASQKKNPHETRYPTLPSHSKNRLCTDIRGHPSPTRHQRRQRGNTTADTDL